MKRLEQYLDQVCQSIGGPWEMREHVRQEMREHLLDAVAQHKAAGMTEEQALTRAIDEFGKPDEVRSELESTYGKRTTWILDKALEWKEKTMRAKWLWMTWANVTLITVIGLEFAFIWLLKLFILPKFWKFTNDGLIDTTSLEFDSVSWMPDYLGCLSYSLEQHVPIGLPLAMMTWALFEWRVRSENKSFMRIAALGSIAISFLLVIMLTTASLVIPFCLAMPLMTPMSRPWAIDRVLDVESGLTDLEKAHSNKDWPQMHAKANLLSSQIRFLTFGPSSTALAIGNNQMKAHEIKNTVGGLQRLVKQVADSIQEHDERKLQLAITDLRAGYEPLRDAVKKLDR